MKEYFCLAIMFLAILFMIGSQCYFLSIKNITLSIIDFVLVSPAIIVGVNKIRDWSVNSSDIMKRNDF